MFSSIQFDFTLTLGALVQIGLLVFAIIGGWFKLKQETETMESDLKRVEKMVTEFRESCAQCRFVEFSTRHAEIIIQHDQRLKTVEALIPAIHEQNAELKVVTKWLERIEAKVSR